MVRHCLFYTRLKKRVLLCVDCFFKVCVWLPNVVVVVVVAACFCRDFFSGFYLWFFSGLYWVLEGSYIMAGHRGPLAVERPKGGFSGPFKRNL